MPDDIDDVDDLPRPPSDLARDNPEIWEHYTDLGRACAEAGPVSGEEKRLVKLAMAIAAGSEGAVHSHARRGLEEGVAADAMEHVAILAIPTIGFPDAMAGLSWVRDMTEG